MAQHPDRKGKDHTVELYKKLASIPSPSGEEKQVAEFIKKELSKIGISYYTDDSWKKNHSNTGNVIATLNGSGKCTVMFYAHMDTVAPNLTKAEIVEDKGAIRSVNGTIMGADDKTGVAALISALKEIKEKEHPTIVVAFTTKEEGPGKKEGDLGARFLSPRKKPDYTFVIDDEGKAGSFASRALGCLDFKITFKGRGAHAASNPEKGINAIKAATLFVNSLRLGRSKEGDCLNIGTVSGGTFDNVIPANAAVTGELRAFEYKRMLRQLALVHRCAKKACKATGCSYAFKKRMLIYPLNSEDPRLMRIAEAAARRANVTFRSEDMYATCEANILHRKGHNAIVMRPGYWNPHSTNEYTTTEELVKCKRLVVAISEILSMRNPKA